MLFFLTAMMNSFFPQDEMIFESPYVQEADSEGDDGDETVFLAYASPEKASSKIINISMEPSDDSADDEEAKEEAESNETENQYSEENDAEVQETSTKQIAQSLEKEFGEIRMVQLANAIAKDMGMITKITFIK